MNLTYFTAPSFKKKQIVTTEVKGLPAVAGHEDQPFVDFVSFCSKSLFLAGAVLFLGLATSVQAQFTYTTNNGAITITGYTGSGGAVTIPNVIDGLPVTDIGTNAFYESSVTSVLIPDTVTVVGSEAFENCSDLTNLTLSLGLADIESNAFYNCSSVASVTIPDSVTNIGDEAFYDCNLTSVTFGDSVTSIGNYAFSGLASRGLGDPTVPTGSPLTTVTIPSSVTNIGVGAFEGCMWLTNVTFGVGLTTIGAYAFDDCGLTNAVTIPDSVTNIGTRTFSDCGALTAINVASNNPAYSSLNGVLFNKTQTVLLEYPGCLGGSYAIPDGVTNIGTGAFEYCDSLTNVTISLGVTDIGSNAFYGCDGLTSLTLPDSVTNIGDYAFFGCEALTNVTMAEGLASIGAYAFSGSSRTVGNVGPIVCHITSITIPSSVTNIGPGAFANCLWLTNVTFGDGLTGIGNYAFEGCGLTNAVTIPDSVTNIGTGAFSASYTLTAINVAPGDPAYSSLGGVLFNKSQTTLIEFPSGYSAAAYSIPNTVTNIGAYAFEYSSLTNVTIPDSVTSIGPYAFEYSSLTSVTIPDSLTNIGAGAFQRCYGLLAINVAPGNPAYSSLGGVLFNQSQTELIEDPDCLGGSYAIPAGVTTIESNAFYYSAVTNVTIPDTVTSIEPYAFEYSSLTSVTIPSSVTNIGEGAFSACYGLADVYFLGNAPTAAPTAFSGDSLVVYSLAGASGWSSTLAGFPVELLDSMISLGYTVSNGTVWIDSYAGSSTLLSIPGTIDGMPVTGIGAAAFAGSDLTSVTIPGSVTNIGAYAFQGCGLGNVTIGNSVASIGDYAFYYCTRLTSVTIPNSVSNLGAYAFANCTNLTTITFGVGLTTIGESAFLGCSSLTAFNVAPGNPAYSSLAGVLFNQNQTTLLKYPGGLGGSYTIPSGVSSIASNAFYGCVTLTSVTIGNSVASIGDYAFLYCSRLTSVTIPNSVTSIGESAFAASGLTSLTIPDSVTNIGDYAFSGCFGLTSVTFGDGITSIGAGAFDYCTRLTSVTIPNSVTSIGESAFELCSGLTSVIIPNSVTNIGDYAFNGCSDLTNVTIPNSVTGIGGDAFAASGLTSVTIPNSVTSIGSSSFANCRALINVTFPTSVTSIGEDAFYGCSDLTSAFFLGNAPSADTTVFSGDSLTAYYLPGTTGWAEFATNTGVATALWTLPYPLVLNGSSGVLNNQFGFTISWATNVPVVVEASTDLSQRVWTPIATNTLTGGTSYFSDPQWTNYPARFYRLK
jgi:hypothetical protein